MNGFLRTAIKVPFSHSDMFNVNTNALEAAKAEIIASEAWLNRHEQIPYS